MQDNVNKLIATLLNELLEADEKRLQKRIDEIIDMNKEGSKDHLAPMGFVYEGIHYKKEGQPYNTAYPTLSFHLTDEMEDFKKDKDRVDLDRQKIKQILFKLLIDCKDSQDVRDVLPECLMQYLPGFASKQRTRDAGYILERDPRAYAQYKHVLVKIEMYSVAKLLY